MLGLPDRCEEHVCLGLTMTEDPRNIPDEESTETDHVKRVEGFPE